MVTDILYYGVITVSVIAVLLAWYRGDIYNGMLWLWQRD